MTPKSRILQVKNCRTWQVVGSKIIENHQTSIMDVPSLKSESKVGCLSDRNSKTLCSFPTGIIDNLEACRFQLDGQQNQSLKLELKHSNKPNSTLLMSKSKVDCISDQTSKTVCSFPTRITGQLGILQIFIGRPTKLVLEA